MSENRSKRISQLPITQYPQISGSTVIVQDGVTYQTSYENIKNNIFPMDQEVTSGSTNPVASSGIYQAIDELNVPNADKVGDNTTPINTDRTYFYNTISGWFYVAWEKMVRLLRGGSGAFAQPVYLTNIDSDITGYKVLSYNNDVDLSEVSISTDDNPVVYLYPDGLGLETLPNGPYFFSFRARLSSTVGDTTLRITSFVRDSLGNERDLFTTQTNDINSSSYVDIGIRVLEPSYVVNPSERYGVRVSAVTTHATAKTITFHQGDGYGAYFTTPIALRHNLLRGRNEADSHPASAITVSDPVTPDYTAPEVGDTMQDITNKVAGLQDRVIWEEVDANKRVNDLGSVSGNVEINLNNGDYIKAELTGPTTFSFTGLPTTEYIKDFSIYLVGIQEVVFPIGTKFAGGVPPVVIASPYMFVCSIDSAGVLTVYSVIDNIIVPV